MDADQPYKLAGDPILEAIDSPIETVDSLFEFLVEPVDSRLYAFKRSPHVCKPPRVLLHFALEIRNTLLGRGDTRSSRLQEACRWINLASLGIGLTTLAGLARTVDDPAGYICTLGM